MLPDKLVFNPKWDGRETVPGSQVQASEQSMPHRCGLQTLPSTEDKGADRLC